MKQEALPSLLAMIVRVPSSDQSFDQLSDLLPLHRAQERVPLAM